MGDNNLDEDQERVLLVVSGNKEAFRELFNKYRNQVFSIALKFTHDISVAEDLVQEIFVKLWLQKEKLQAVNHFNAYLNTLIKNHIFNHLRKVANEHKMKQRFEKTGMRQSTMMSDLLHYKELQRLIREAVAKLPPQQQKVYQFSRQQGLKHEEIAQRMGISRSTVKGHMVEALNSIKNYLSARGEIIRGLILLFLIEW